MLKNYFKIAYRNLFKSKLYSLLNILGLAIGVASSLLIFLFVQYELSYDQYHEKSDQIYRVAVRGMMGDTKIEQVFTPAIMTETFIKDYPEVLHSVRIQNYSQGRIVKYQDHAFNEKRVAGVDADIFQVFTLPFITGDPETALREPNSVVIAETAARKYFGDDDPINEILSIYGTDFRVTGLMEDMPENSHFHFDFLFSIHTFNGINDPGWFSNNFKTYILLREDYSQQEFEAKFPDMVRRYMWADGDYDAWAASGDFWEFYLQPIRDIHLHSDLSGELEPNGNATYISLFALIALFILMIACINYMNLSTARSVKRVKEVGMRKVVGSTRSQLIVQFLGESLFSSFIAVLLALALVELALPAFRSFVGKPLSIPYFESFLILPAFIGFAMLMGLLAGSYPSFFLSSFKPIAALKGNLLGGERKNTFFRNGLVVLQFSISIFLVAGTAIVYQQLQYLQNKTLGFEKEQIVVVKTPQSLGIVSDRFKNALKESPEILAVSGSTTLPGQFFPNIFFRPEGREQGTTINIGGVDYDFQKTFDLELVAGRFFSRDFVTDSIALVINENAAELLGWEDPVGKHLQGLGHDCKIIGVVKDIHFESLHQKIRPMAFYLIPGAMFWPERYISVRLQTENLSATLGFIQKNWDAVAPEAPFEYSFMDEDYDRLYQNEERTANVFIIFSVLAMLIACLGLFGLAASAAEQRTKEIGIRKVLGASVAGLILLLSKEFTKWVLIANIIAWPLAWLAMNQWLQNFAYRTDVGWEIFIFSGILAFIIALLTVSFQAIKTAFANPVDALKYE